MTINEVAVALSDRFGDRIKDLNNEATDPWIVVEAEGWDEIALYLRDDERLKFDSLCDLTGVDYCEPDPKKQAKFGHEEHVEVVYHLYSFTHRHRATIKVKLPRWKNDVVGEIPTCPTVSHVWAIADWHEREAYDLVGIEFTGHPNLRRLIMPSDWAGHPLRKDYPIGGEPVQFTDDV